MTKRYWRVLVPALVTVGLAGAAIPALAAENARDDKGNNPLKARMSFHCNSDHTVRLDWHSISPRQAARMTADWYDGTIDPDLTSPTPAGVHRSGGRASGSATIPAGHNRHRIFLFVEALDKDGNQTSAGLGRTDATIRC